MADDTGTGKEFEGKSFVRWWSALCFVQQLRTAEPGRLSGAWSAHPHSTDEGKRAGLTRS